jgi:mutator protein MutT
VQGWLAVTAADTRLVVAAAIVVDGRLLAARRTQPARLAGGWELPGGKVQPGESLEQACAREILEELGVVVEPLCRLGGEQQLGAGMTLSVVVARMVSGEPEPVLHEHDALRWLAPEELDEVTWLPADLPLLPVLRALLLPGAPLPGGNVGGAVRIGETVRRPTGHWTPAVHALLEHVAARGLDAVPRVLGVDERGREVLTYLPGQVNYTPQERLDDARLESLARWVRRYHDAVADFLPTPSMRWRFEDRAPEPGEIICHHDVGWYNAVFCGEVLTGVFDWDVAGPGLPLDDLAFLAWHDVPLATPAPDAARRLRLIARAYGHVSAIDVVRHVPIRIERSRRMITGGARAGDAGMRRLVATGVLQRIDRGLASLRSMLPELERALR